MVCFFSRSLSATIADILQKLISQREEIDSKENATDNQHDLPVYHRIHGILTILVRHINRFDNEIQLAFRSLASIILEFDKTFAFLVGTLLVRLAQNRDDLESTLILLKANLPENYFENILIRLAALVCDDNFCPFIQRLNINEKFHLVEWFIKEKDQGIFVFNLLKMQILNQATIDRERCQYLLRQLRQSDNFFLRQQALEYTVRWKKKPKTVKHQYQQQHAQKRVPDDFSDSNISDVNLFEFFDIVQT